MATIVSDPDIMLGRPVVFGTTVTVELLLEQLAAGEPMENIQKSHPDLPEGSLEASLHFAATTIRNESYLNLYS